MRERVYRRLATVAAVSVVALVALTGRADAGTTYSVSTIAMLDAAVAAVNAGTGGDVIVLAPGFYSLTNQLVINQNVTIQGDASGPTVVDGAGLPSAFWLRANASMLNLTIQNAGSSISWDSVGIFTGTGLTLTGSRNGLGAGDSEGEIFLTNSTISNNTTNGIENSCANLHLTNVTLSGNGRGVSFVHTCSNPVIQFTNALIVANTLDCGGDTAGLNAIGTASIDSDGTCVSRGFGPGMATATVAAVGLGSLAANLEIGRAHV